MWIWYVSRSDAGNTAAIIAQAHAAGVTTLFIKSSDGASNYWSQFSPQLVAELHANGLRVCAWQYVYGSDPSGEAALGAEAVTDGADCLVIDAESEYEGHYAAAQTYLADLRASVGASYPIGLASFPEISYHESFPYSVFLGPGGAQYDLPQMYWHDIGISVDTVYANTYIANRVYGRPIFPLGQTYGSISSAELLRFREEASDYGATGYSFWDWQETSAAGWSTLAAPLAPLTSVTPNAEWPELHSGSKGDQVLWMQEHLATAIPTQEVDGHLRERDPRKRGELPDRARDRADRGRGSGHLDRAAGPTPRRGQLDGGRAERLKPTLGGAAQTRWISVPVPRPPPQHIVTRPVSLSERSSSCSSVVISRAPVEPERVAQRHRTTVDVDPVHVGVELAAPRRHDRGERLVDLDQVDVVDRHPVALEDFARRGDRSLEHFHRVAADRGLIDDAGARASARAPWPSPPTSAARRQHRRRSARRCPR